MRHHARKFDDHNKLIVISGCSGGGKSTLITELSKRGYVVVHEAAREILREQLAINGNSTPEKNPIDFCKLLINRTLEDFYSAKSIPNVLEKVIFFDRSHLEGIRYYQMLNATDMTQYDYFIKELRYFENVYIVPPWEEIFCQDEERKHSFKKSVDDYKKLVSFYLECGYKAVELPKVDVSSRVQFIINSIH